MHNPKLHELSEAWLIEATIEDLQQAMSDGEITSRDLVLMYLNRIASYDKQGIALNSVIEVNPDALQIAEALDSERKALGIRGALHGIPILIKDNISTKDKMHTSAGSLALADSYASEDAFIVKKLRESGAVILGKTNLTEFANFMTYQMPSGYSSRGGQVLNPYGPGKFDVGGSSSGSGAAIAANLATCSIGTETSGSILSPASQNSIVGIKPTIGLISRTGIIPIAHSQDTAGPMARTVTDAAILLGVLTGQDPTDPITALYEGNAQPDYTTFLQRDGLKGARIGIARDVYFEYLDEEKLQLMNAAIAVLKAEGAEIIDSITIPSTKENWDINVLIYEFKADLNHYLSTLPPSNPIRSLKDIIDFNFHHPQATLKYGQKLLLAAEETSGTLTEKEYIESREKDLYYSTEKGIDYACKEHQLDAIIFPANYGASLPAKAGYPSITVPAGYTSQGEPLGLTFTGLAFSEPTLIRLAYSYEQATKHRFPPILDKAEG